MYSPVRILTEAPYLLVDLSSLLPCSLKLFLLLFFIPTLRELRRREVREGAAHKLKPHCLSEPPLYQVRTPTYMKLQNSRNPIGLGVAGHPFRVKQVLTGLYEKEHHTVGLVVGTGESDLVVAVCCILGTSKD